MMKTQLTNWKFLMLISLINGTIQSLVTMLFWITNLYPRPFYSALDITIPLLVASGGLTWYQNCFSGEKESYLRIMYNGVLISLFSGMMYLFYNLVTIHVFYPDFIHDIIILKSRLLGSNWDVVNDTANKVFISAEKQEIENITRMNFMMFVFGGSACSAIVSIFLRRKIE